MRPGHAVAGAAGAAVGVGLLAVAAWVASWVYGLMVHGALLVLRP